MRDIGQTFAPSSSASAASSAKSTRPLAESRTAPPSDIAGGSCLYRLDEPQERSNVVPRSPARCPTAFWPDNSQIKEIVKVGNVSAGVAGHSGPDRTPGRRYARRLSRLTLCFWYAAI